MARSLDPVGDYRVKERKVEQAGPALGDQCEVHHSLRRKRTAPTMRGRYAATSDFAFHPQLNHIALRYAS
jgi:hypothetical protein